MDAYEKAFVIACIEIRVAGEKKAAKKANKK